MVFTYISRIGKRANLSAKEMTAIIIVLISTIVMLYFVIQVRDHIQGAANLECAAAVREANIHNKFWGRDKAMEIKSCQTQTITITRKSLPSDWPKADLQVKHILAEQMRTCWRDAKSFRTMTWHASSRPNSAIRCFLLTI